MNKDLNLSDLMKMSDEEFNKLVERMRIVKDLSERDSRQWERAYHYPAYPPITHPHPNQGNYPWWGISPVTVDGTGMGK